MTVCIIVAFSKNFVIGNENDIPWYIREDMLYFKKTTMDKIVIMGRKTYESIPEKHRPLLGRTTYLLTRDPTYTVDHPNVKIFHSFTKALFAAKLVSYDDEIMIAGGAEIYKQAMPHADKIYATVIQQDFEGDTLFPPPLVEEWFLTDSFEDFHDPQLDLLYSRCVYQRKSGTEPNVAYRIA